MSRPTSSASQHRPSGPGNGMMGGEAMGRVHTYSPTPSASSSHHHQIYYSQEHLVPNGFMQEFGGSYGGDMHGQMIAPYAGHPVAQGRMAIPMGGQPGNVIAINPGRGSKMPVTSTPPANGFEDLGPSPFLPEEDSTPYLPVQFDSYGQLSESPSMGLQLLPNQLVSPTEHMNMARMGPQLHRSNTMPLMGHQTQYQPLQPGRQRMVAQRPGLVQRQSMAGPIQRPAPLSRHASINGPTRSASPHIAGDMFDPVPPGANGSPLLRQQMQPMPMPVPENMDMSWDLSSFDPAFGISGTGISPARALGPAPMQPQRFSPHRQEYMVTPQGNRTNYPDAIHSSATSVASTSASTSSISSMSEISVRSSRQQIAKTEIDSSDDEHDSPTRGPSNSRSMRKMHLEEKKPVAAQRPMRPPPKSVGQGGRTSAKFAKVADDPGVEGIPPGPRSTERPAPSFACIIGQAILRCKAGGLSLEHIYRYVETAYPYFQKGDGAWRNSVRHNLSIHKMFETIPRTEAFPPGKGGIWIIHEEEKCHWPANDKFIKNFPPTHPHHAVCRQTLHEKAKEKEAMDKAAREGRIYVPKKGKKGRKLPTKDDDEEDAIDMVRTSSILTEAPAQASASEQEAEAESSTPIPEVEDSTTPTMKPKTMLPPPIQSLGSADHADLEDEEGEFLPIEPEASELVPVDATPVPPVHKRDDQLARNGAMIPPRFERKEKRRPLVIDDDNVFTAAKRVRVADPLAPIHPMPQETVKELDDSFITPERERPSSNSKVMSSAFKTPALIQTSSSPGSSPMPQTITRSTHHPSALQQAWTQDDMNKSPGQDSSPVRPMLDAAFDFKPKAPRTLTLTQEDEFVPTAISHVDARAPPKTPVTRSSAATDKTPRLQHLRTPSLSKTPMFFGGSPALPPPSASALLSTPMWEVGGVLDRLKDHLTGSPTQSIRSPMPSTDPTRYAMLLDSGGSPRKRRDVS